MCFERLLKLDKVKQEQGLTKRTRYFVLESVYQQIDCVCTFVLASDVYCGTRDLMLGKAL